VRRKAFCRPRWSAADAPPPRVIKRGGERVAAPPHPEEPAVEGTERASTSACRDALHLASPGRAAAVERRRRSIGSSRRGDRCGRCGK